MGEVGVAPESVRLLFARLFSAVGTIVGLEGGRSRCECVCVCVCV